MEYIIEGNNIDVEVYILFRNIHSIFMRMLILSFLEKNSQLLNYVIRNFNTEHAFNRIKAKTKMKCHF